MVTGSTDKTIRIYDVHTFAEQLRFSHPEGVERVFYIDDDRRLLVCDAKYFTIVNPTTGQTMLRIPNEHRRENRAAVDPSGRVFAVPRHDDVEVLTLKYRSSDRPQP